MKNLHAEPVRVKHADLERWDPESAYKSKCPACEAGLLLVYRDRTTFRLARTDRCISCAQTVIYTDAEISGEAFSESLG